MTWCVVHVKVIGLFDFKAILNVIDPQELATAGTTAQTDVLVHR